MSNLTSAVRVLVGDPKGIIVLDSDVDDLTTIADRFPVGDKATLIAAIWMWNHHAFELGDRLAMACGLTRESVEEWRGRSRDEGT